MFPLIPILAIAAIIGGVATLSWYAGLTKTEKNRADSLAMKYFGQRFQQLAENKQRQIRERMNG